MRPIIIRSSMADAPQTSDGGIGPGEPGYLRWVSHELRQPLVVAVGYVSMLEDGSFGELPTEASAVLRTVAERLEAMSAIIDGMADGATKPAQD
jgi:light-regulated signal transduction histidine kinase (bacteriophytochrome)